MDVNKIIGENIKKYRTAYNMTLKDLSEKLHKSISTVSKYEKGEISLDMTTFLEAAKVFHISPSALLCGISEQSVDHPEHKDEAEQLYMYTYSSPKKEIIRSLIEQYPPVSPGGPFRVHLFNDIQEWGNPGRCNGFYTGAYTENGFLGTYLLKNQHSSSEQVMISCVKNLVNVNQQLGLISGLSNYTMLPIVFKTVLSRIEITDRKHLLDLLLFSKEDFRTLKQAHCLTIQNLR